MDSYERRPRNPSETNPNLPLPLGDEQISPPEAQGCRAVNRVVSSTAASATAPAADRSQGNGRVRGGDAYIPLDIPLPPADIRSLWADRRLRRAAVLAILLTAGAVFCLVKFHSCGKENPPDGSFGVLPVGSTAADAVTVGTPATEEGSGDTTEPAEPTESTAEPSSESDTHPAVEPDSETAESHDPPETAESSPVETSAAETVAETAEPPAESAAETVPDTTPTPETPPETTPVSPPDSTPETEPPMPADAFPVVRVDLSEPDRSVGYIQSTADRLPPSIPAEGTRLWSTAATPTVLLVHTHPYEGYHDGRDWYDPASGSLAQTESPNDPDGVVALGATLTRQLREAGVTVIHLRVPVAEGESAAATYARTEETVRYYCELYPDIGLVLDLRRSAELSENGEILRTTGQYNGEDCAQIRLSVSGDRPVEAVSRDIAAAVALRQALWAKEATISRPVWVKSGTGLVADAGRVVMITAEVGSCGNSFREAEILMEPLADALAALVKK